MAPHTFPRSDDDPGRIDLGRRGRALRSDLAAPTAALPAAARTRGPRPAWAACGVATRGEVRRLR